MLAVTGGGIVLERTHAVRDILGVGNRRLIVGRVFLMVTGLLKEEGLDLGEVFGRMGIQRASISFFAILKFYLFLH